MNSLEGLQSQQNTAQQSMNDALYQAQLQQAQDAITAQAFDTPNYDGLTIPQYDTGADSSPAKTPGAPATKPAPAKSAASTFAANKMLNLKAPTAALKPILPKPKKTTTKKKG